MYAKMIKDLEVNNLFIYKDYGDFCYVCVYLRCSTNDDGEKVAVVSPLGILSKPFAIPLDTIVFSSIKGLEIYLEGDAYEEEK